MSNHGAAPRAAVSVSNARAEASRKNGAKSRGPKTAEGKAHIAQNALKHGLRAQKYVVLPQEDAAEFAGLEAALVAELAPVGARRSGAILVVAPGSQARRRCSPGGSWSRPGGSRGRIAWPPQRGWGPVPRPGGQEADLVEERHIPTGTLGLALIRDGNGTRSFETRWREPAPALVGGALRPTAIAARRWRSSGARYARSRPFRPSSRSTPAPP